MILSLDWIIVFPQSQPRSFLCKLNACEWLDAIDRVCLSIVIVASRVRISIDARSRKCRKPDRGFLVNVYPSDDSGLIAQNGKGKHCDRFFSDSKHRWRRCIQGDFPISVTRFRNSIETAADTSLIGRCTSYVAVPLRSRAFGVVVDSYYRLLIRETFQRWNRKTISSVLVVMEVWVTTRGLWLLRKIKFRVKIVFLGSKWT